MDGVQVVGQEKLDVVRKKLEQLEKQKIPGQVQKTLQYS